MLTSEQILKIAQNLQPRLHALIQDPNRAAAVDRQLPELMARNNAGEDIAQEMFDLLDGSVLDVCFLAKWTIQTPSD